MRGTESDDIIKRRLQHAIEDLKISEKIQFDLVIVNSDLNESFQKFKIFVKEVSSTINNGIGVYLTLTEIN